nr:hypothetical protein [Kibdelosporangium sp. MJ126-NF4]
MHGQVFSLDGSQWDRLRLPPLGRCRRPASPGLLVGSDLLRQGAQLVDAITHWPHPWL